MLYFDCFKQPIVERTDGHYREVTTCGEEQEVFEVIRKEISEEEFKERTVKEIS